MSHQNKNKMRKVASLVGFLAIVAVLAYCAYSGSTKEKSDYNKSDTAKVVVSRETNDLQVVVVSNHKPEKQFADITYGGFWFSSAIENDPYLVRSERWIREVNDRANGRRTRAIHVQRQCNPLT
jgi:hypothetical protein